MRSKFGRSAQSLDVQMGAGCCNGWTAVRRRKPRSDAHHEVNQFVEGGRCGRPGHSEALLVDIPGQDAGVIEVRVDGLLK
eukprot:1539947-Pyramimonas_sp.AAC.1